MSVSFLPSQNYGGRSRATIIVNASGGGDYTHIQWAIDNASDGDVIFVEEGTYNENVLIEKTITLLGQGRENTTIHGIEDDHVIRVTVDSVAIRNLHITNSTISKSFFNGTYGIILQDANYC